MKPIERLLLAIACLALGAALFAGCGGDDGSGIEGPSADGETDPQTILESALGSEGEAIESGVLELTLDVQGGAAAAINASVGGPFQSNGEDELPSLDFDFDIDAATGGPSLAFEGNLTLTPDGMFIGYGGSEFQLDDNTFALLQQSYQQSSQLQQDQEETGGSLSQFGIDPSNWLTDVVNEGTEDVDGTETVHVSGQADVPRMVEDLSTVAQATGQTGVDSAGLEELRRSVRAASIDVYADASNSSLRRLDVSLEIADPSSGGTDALSFSIGIADPNSEQDIEAPDDAQPLEDLIGQIPGLAESLGGIAGGTGTGSTGVAPSPSPVSPEATEKYYDCVAGAGSAQEIEDCQKLLG